MEKKFGFGGFGGSLKVDSVQALAANLGPEIPEIYVRPERKEDIVAGDEEDSGESFPVIDFGRLFDSKCSEEEAAKLHSACQGWGFFQLVNHGIPEDVISKLRQDTEEFFKLPLEEKEKIAQLPGQTEGYGQFLVQSKEHKLDWADRLGFVTFPPNNKQLKFWPTNPPSFRETIDAYAIEIKKVANGLLKMISKNLGLEFEKFYDIFKGGIQYFRFNYYPPCPSPEKVLGLCPHSDPMGLTILLQVNDLQGLQIRRKDRWLPVQVIPGALIINIGDIIEILSNRKYKSIVHRAVVNNEKERLSVAAFHSLNIGDLVGPIPEIVKGDELLYKSLQYEEYFKQVVASKLEGKTILDHMKLDK
ncbi:S-norcoclaurine synthase 1 isoform X1 [Dendrobium catenatum]|uniref:S-norcoclaurine synthase 1 isoform X1 n=1 Tax=Dendrobium catenatum TaxID=906689 RepID=UPI0009F22874|nr:S-norcoclaurine synthase 1 isoform X1 [Dendrobium catenatum]